MQATMSWRPFIRSRPSAFSRPWATYLLMFAVIAVMFVEIAIVLTGMNVVAFMETFGLVSAKFSWSDPGAYIALITFNFLHSGARHFAANAVVMLLAGAAVEKHAGKRATLFIWLAGGITSGIFHLLMFPDTGRALVGASGAIAALIGAAFVLGWRWALPVKLWRGRKTLFHIPLPLVISIWVAFQMYGTVRLYSGSISEPSVATWVHLAGFMFGAVTAGVLQLLQQRRVTPRPLPVQSAASGD